MTEYRVTVSFIAEIKLDIDANGVTEAMAEALAYDYSTVDAVSPEGKEITVEGVEEL